MTETTKTNEKPIRNICGEPAFFRYTWAGRDESYVCLFHAGQFNGAAIAMGYYVQMIPFSDEGHLCQQTIKDR